MHCNAEHTLLASVILVQKAEISALESTVSAVLSVKEC